MAPVAAQPSKFNIASGVGPDLRPLHGPWWQQESWISTQETCCSRAIGPNMTPDSSLGLKSPWSWVKAQGSGIGMAPIGVHHMITGSGPDLGHLQGPRW